MSRSTEITTPGEAKKLRIFLSYSSAQLVLAEQVEMALTASGHDVFFDRTHLPPGGEYNNAIHERIRTSDLFVFLISPESISKGHYARTELRYAQDTWRNPIGRILPVMTVETDFALIPTYLKGGSILRPEGNLPAEVTAAVNNLAAGIGPNETFAEHIKLVRKTAKEAATLRRTILQIKNDLQEEKQAGNVNGIEIDPQVAIGGLIFLLVMLVMFYLFGVFVLSLLLITAAIAVVSYYLRHGRNTVEEDYYNGLPEASSDQDLDDKPMFSDFDELMKRTKK